MSTATPPTTAPMITPPQTLPAPTTPEPAPAPPNHVPNTAAGRPRLFTPEKQAQFCDLLRLGLSRTEAARTVGVSIRTLYNHERDNPEFAEAMCVGRLPPSFCGESQQLFHTQVATVAAAVR